MVTRFAGFPVWSFDCFLGTAQTVRPAALAAKPTEHLLANVMDKNAFDIQVTNVSFCVFFYSS